MRYWREREVSGRLISGRNHRRELRNRELPEAIGFHDPRCEPECDED